MKENYGCPVRATINALSGKWKVQIVWHLSFGPLRFAEVRTKLGRVSDKVLAEQLRQLEADGIVGRRVSESVPPGVTYFLNTEGTKLVPLLESLCDWGSVHFNMKPSLPHPAAATTP